MSQATPPDWFTAALQNPQVTDLCVNGTYGAFYDQGEGLEWIPASGKSRFSGDQLLEWVLGVLTQVGKTWDAKYPFVDATLHSGHRLHVTFPPLSQHGILLSLRRLPKRASLDPAQFNRFYAEGRVSQKRWQKVTSFYQTLSDAVRRGDSILISGATGSGKTTLAADLLEEVPSHERIIALEDTAELAPEHPHFLSLVSRAPNADGFGEVSLSTLFRQALRMRPDRIILGECRGSEVVELLQALNTGHKGALATLHANSPRDALRRLELLCLLATSGALPVSGIRELLALGVQWVVQVQRDSTGRHISEVCHIEGREGDTILMRPL